MQSLLVCTGGSAFADHAVRLTGTRTKHLPAGLTVLSVLPFSIMYGMRGRDNLELTERHPVEANSLQKLTHDVETTHGIRPNIRLRQGIPEEEILEDVQETGHDLVIVGSSSREGVSGMLSGNTSCTIVKHANTSVLIATEPPDV